MKTIIEMAREAGGLGFVHDAGDAPSKWQFTPKELERFAELIRADERDRAMRENAYVLAEREACAKAVLKVANDDAGNPYKQALRMGAEAIRARGNT